LVAKNLPFTVVYCSGQVTNFASSSYGIQHDNNVSKVHMQLFLRILKLFYENQKIPRSWAPCNWVSLCTYLCMKFSPHLKQTTSLGSILRILSSAPMFWCSQVLTLWNRMKISLPVSWTKVCQVGVGKALGMSFFAHDLTPIINEWTFLCQRICFSLLQQQPIFLIV
jgi:hypothetical protein